MSANDAKRILLNYLAVAARGNAAVFNTNDARVEIDSIIDETITAAVVECIGQGGVELRDIKARLTHLENALTGRLTREQRLEQLVRQAVSVYETLDATIATETWLTEAREVLG